MNDLEVADLSTPEGQLSHLWANYRARWQERDDRHSKFDRIARGDWTALGPEDDPLENRSPNLVQVAQEDTSEAASLIPSVRVKPSTGTPEAKRKAGVMEPLGTSYLDQSEIALLTIQSLMNLSGLGIQSWVVQPPTPEFPSPRIEWRDPRTCYPEPDFGTFSGIRKCFFARDVYVTQLPEAYQAKFMEHWRSVKGKDTPVPDWRLTLLEYFTEDTTTIAAVYENTAPWSVPGVTTTRLDPAGRSAYVSVIFETIKNEIGVCPAVVTHRIVNDSEPRGQFDQVIKVLQAHIRLAALSLDYADQAVYNEIWVKDLIGPLVTGGDGFIQLGPNGAIGRLQPAVSSLSLYQELQQLVDNFHIGARWPKVRPGEVDQAIASAKFVEATAGMMNTVIRTYHLLLKGAFERALRIAFALDKRYGKTRTVTGVHRNQQFAIERKTSDIDLGATVRVEYGLGLGRDPAQSMVLGIQGAQSGIVSMEFVQENFEGVTDVQLEKARIDAEALRGVVMAQILKEAEGGMLPPGAIAKIAQGRLNGEDIFELYDKYVEQAKADAMAQMVPTMGGPMAPGPDAGAPLPAPPPPDPAALLGGLMGGGGGAPPESMARLSTPAGGPGSFAGTTATV